MIWWFEAVVVDQMFWKSANNQVVKTVLFAIDHWINALVDKMQ